MANWVTDNRKIGIGLTCFGSLFLVMGVMFFFDRGLLLLGNTLFLAGITALIGAKKTVKFFLNPAKIRGTLCFMIGILLVVLKFPIFGILVESFGIINLFGNFFPIILGFLRNIPGLEKILNLPIVSKILDKLAGYDNSGSYLPTSNHQD